MFLTLFLTLIFYFIFQCLYQVYKVSVPALAATQQSEIVLGLNNSSSLKNGKNNGVQGVPLPTTKPVSLLLFIFGSGTYLM